MHIYFQQQIMFETIHFHWYASKIENLYEHHPHLSFQFHGDLSFQLLLLRFYLFDDLRIGFLELEIVQVELFPVHTAPSLQLLINIELQYPICILDLFVDEFIDCLLDSWQLFFYFSLCFDHIMIQKGISKFVNVKFMAFEFVKFPEQVYKLLHIERVQLGPGNFDPLFFLVGGLKFTLRTVQLLRNGIDFDNWLLMAGTHNLILIVFHGLDRVCSIVDHKLIWGAGQNKMNHLLSSDNNYYGQYTVMNYYSRSSPIKNKNRSIHPDTEHRPPSSRKLTPRSILSRHHSMNQSTSKIDDSDWNPDSEQILIVESYDSDHQHHDNNQILIVDEDSSDEEGIMVNQHQILEQVIIETQQEQFNDHSQPESEHQPVEPAQKEEILQVVNPLAYKEHEARQQVIERNYSFGNSNDIWSANQSNSQSSYSVRSLKNNSIIRKLFDPAVIQQRSSDNQKELSSKSSKQSIQSSKKKPQVYIGSGASKEEEWQKYLEMFMKKRIKQKTRSNEISEKQESETGEHYSEAIINKKQEQSSYESGYFNIPIETSENNLNLHDQIMQTQQMESQPSNQPYTRILRLLSESFIEIPPNLIGPFLKIHEQMVKKQQQFLTIQRKQQQTIAMMQNLIQSHHKLIYIDDYLLADHEDATQEAISANQEIILSLIRKLGCLL